MINYSKFMEALSAKQKKMDANKNGKIDGEDLQKLRKEESCGCDCGESPCVECGEDHHEMKEGYVPSADMKPAKDGRMLPARKIQVNRDNDDDDKKKKVDEVVRVRDTIRHGLDKTHGEKGPTLQHKMDRSELASAAKDRRAKTSGSGVSGFNARIKKKDQEHRDTGHVKAVNVKEDIEEIAERNKENALKRKTMDASRGARYKAAGNPVPDAEPEHKTGQQHNKAIGRALRNEDLTPAQKAARLQLIKKTAEKMRKRAEADAKKAIRRDPDLKKPKVDHADLDEATPNRQQVKQAIGIARDKRYAGGNMTGATKAMDKINKGLAQHPAVSKELKKQNEQVELDPAGSDLYHEERKSYKTFIKTYK